MTSTSSIASAQPGPNRDEIREMILAHMDVPKTIAHFTVEGAIDSSDLWWFFDEYRIMAGADAWLMAMLWEDSLSDHDVELLSDPSFWVWFDRGRR